MHPGLQDAPFLAAARRRLGRGGPTPVWFMRQAGRALPEYRKLREGVAMLDSCRDPDLTVEFTLQPVRRYGVDAAIFFSDIVVPLAAVGVDLDIVAGTGPVIAAPIRDQAAVAALRPLEPDAVPLHHRVDRPAGRGARRHPAHRFRRSALHPRQLPDRGRAEPQLRAYQSSHVRRAGRLARARVAAR